jgi:hypothetical protein
MPKYLICFQVEQLLSGTIQVEAKSPEDARAGFYLGDYDHARLTATLDLEDSDDAILEIREGCAANFYDDQTVVS